MVKVERMSEELFNMLLQRAGLEIPQGERERLKAFYDQSILQLNSLHMADVEDEEVAGVFSPQWNTE